MNKNLILIFFCQAFILSAGFFTSTTSTLIGLDLTGKESLSTLPISLNTIASLILTIPASYFMARFGRRAGIILGLILGFIGAICIILSLQERNFILFCIGVMFIGFVSAFSNYLRFAAAEVSSPDFKSKAISLVLGAGVIAAFFGPNLYKFTQNIWKFDSIFLSGYILVIPLYLFAFLFILFLKMEKPAPMNLKTSKSIQELLKQTELLKIILIGSISYIIMLLIMTATPLGMTLYNFKLNEITFIIQLHIFGMFLPSFFTGAIIKKIGTNRTMILGILLFSICILINFLNHTYSHFMISLVSLGVGWNFLYIGATTKLALEISKEDQPKAQALNDFTVTAFAAISIATSGKLHEIFGWNYLNLLPLPFLILAFYLILTPKKIHTH